MAYYIDPNAQSTSQPATVATGYSTRNPNAPAFTPATEDTGHYSFLNPNAPAFTPATVATGSSTRNPNAPAFTSRAASVQPRKPNPRLFPELVPDPENDFKLYVTGLPISMTNSDLKDLFVMFNVANSISKVQLIYKYRSKAFVYFKNEAEADQAEKLLNNYRFAGGGQLTVRKYSFRPKMFSPTLNITKVYARGFPANYSPADAELLFLDSNVGASIVRFTYFNTGKQEDLPEAKIWFSNEAEAEAAIAKLDKYTFPTGRYLKVVKTLDKGRFTGKTGYYAKSNLGPEHVASDKIQRLLRYFHFLQKPTDLHPLGWMADCVKQCVKLTEHISDFGVPECLQLHCDPKYRANLHWAKDTVEWHYYDPKDTEKIFEALLDIFIHVYESHSSSPILKDVQSAYLTVYRFADENKFLESADKQKLQFYAHSDWVA